MTELLRIGELAAAAGVSTRTIDFYTSLGLIQPAERTGGGYRLYDQATVEVIATIRQLETSGMALSDIAADLTQAVSPADLAATVTRLDADLTALRTLAETAGPGAHSLVNALTVRAHTLITTAMELIVAMPDV
ncbi:DNA-binding transcriptional MerR regulator [Allocatelliglobosispora scoriae]|uniref:DNA-binding transcriptional MerR regulator n=1 Tax=Allocatelliglobosispora scoriae TaxID=643052 RepID=A0A841BJF0_9ACTN|nr:MerR family transcriptional regulator [Allocatelliglobosispora scoriae]MBB5866950.1 DNA-binding transcriptional MerR regulator [Allocatelliglobosispora scoriae]